jgi:DNA-binding transcriptional regulator YdaS (Cro superfamily)
MAERAHDDGHLGGHLVVGRLEHVDVVVSTEHRITKEYAPLHHATPLSVTVRTVPGACDRIASAVKDDVHQRGDPNPLREDIEPEEWAHQRKRGEEQRADAEGDSTRRRQADSRAIDILLKACALRAHVKSFPTSTARPLRSTPTAEISRREARQSGGCWSRRGRQSAAASGRPVKPDSLSAKR